MTTPATIAAVAPRPAAAAPRAATPAAPRVRAAAMAGDVYRGQAAPERTNLAQPIGMGMVVLGGLGAVMARGNAFFALMGLAAAGLALAGTGVKIQLPDGSSGTAGLRGATVIAPGVGLLAGGLAAMALGLSGAAFVAAAMVPFGVGVLLSRTVFK